MLATSAGTATSAAAATWRVRHVPIGGPALIGDQVSWIAPRRDQGGDRYAAWLESHGPSHRLRAVVYDLAAGRRSYVLSHIPWQLLHGNLALQDDGKLAFVFDPNPHDLHVRSIVAWASPQEPYAHRLGL